MNTKKSEQVQNHICAALLAHVDAGKTTLSEGLLYLSGSIRSWGRVDNQDAFLDMDKMERERGITIFSKQARVALSDRELILMDTPGHIDFSAEMERTLPLLDYAILVISGPDGVQPHTHTLWRLLKRYRIPVFIFVNKMDQPGCEPQAVLQQLRTSLSENCIAFEEDAANTDFLEEAALCSQEAMEEYLKSGTLSTEQFQRMIRNRELFPCYFGSALKLQGVREFLNGLDRYLCAAAYPDEFGARVYKIDRDERGERLTYLKVTGGSLRVRDVLYAAGQGDESTPQAGSKVNQIRLYSGSHCRIAEEVQAGEVCAVTGLDHSFVGQGLGAEQSTYVPILEPVLRYCIQFENDVDSYVAFQKMKEIQEEEPLLRISYDSASKQVQAQVMGKVQCEILARIVRERYGWDIAFTQGRIVYRETIADSVEGIGHFEPLRHYAEVHLLLEPGARGSGIQVDTALDTDTLDRNWQRLILSQLMEKQHRGVLTGAELTDVRMTLVAGRAHQKHTEGGDFRQAAYRAVRQGLMQAQSVLLEPVYAFTLTLPADRLGRGMADIQTAGGRFDPPQNKGDMAILTGIVPVAKMQDYAAVVLEYTQGRGQFQCRPAGYEPCHNANEVIENSAYDPLADLDNPSDSIFCSHGVGTSIRWEKVKEYAHVDSGLTFSGDEPQDTAPMSGQTGTFSEMISEEELEEIFRRTFSANRKPGKSDQHRKKRFAPVYKSSSRPVFRERYLLVDGYNIIYAWEELRKLAKDNLAGARSRLMDILCNYQAYRKIHLILVFDAYKVPGNPGEMFAYHNIHVVYTKQAQTADAYIEKFTHEMGRRYDITVATSDALEQLIVLGQGAKRISAREFEEEIAKMKQELTEQYLNREYE